MTYLKIPLDQFNRVPTAICGVIILATAMLMPTSTLAQTMPLPTGSYAEFQELCEYDGYYDNETGLPVTLSVSEDGYVFGDTYCQFKNLKIYGNDLVFDEICSAEGEDYQSRQVWTKTGPTSFVSGSTEYQKCIRATALDQAEKI